VFVDRTAATWRDISEIAPKSVSKAVLSRQPQQQPLMIVTMSGIPQHHSTTILSNSWFGPRSCRHQSSSCSDVMCVVCDICCTSHFWLQSACTTLSPCLSWLIDGITPDVILAGRKPICLVSLSEGDISVEQHSSPAPGLAQTSQRGVTGSTSFDTVTPANLHPMWLATFGPVGFRTLSGNLFSDGLKSRRVSCCR